MADNLPHSAASNTRGGYIEQCLEELRRTWVLRIVIMGSVLFLLLSVLDYFAAPDYFNEFLAYRIAASSFLLILAHVLRSPWARIRHRTSVLLLVAAIFCAAVTQIMILRLGGGESDYYPGHILIAICVSGFVPVHPGYNIASSSAIYAIYVVSILLFGRVGEARHFLVANLFLLTTLPTLQVIHWLAYQRLLAQLNLEFDLREHQASLELQVRERTSRLSNVITMLRSQIAARRKAEESLVQAQKMESVGRLAGGVAHDFNNLLMIILGHARLVQQDLPTQHPATGDLQTICDAGERGASLIRQLLTFSRHHPTEMRPLNLNKAVEQTSLMLHRLLGEHISLNIRLRATADRIRADASQIDQVLINLAVNARDAMPTGGSLTLETLDASPDLPPPVGEPHVHHEQHVVLRVADTGHGFSPEIAKRIFEPFFTTKEVGKGTGLGLATVYGILAQHHGQIRADSNPDHGACFTLWLPLNSDPDSLPPKATPAILTRGTESILVVDDESQVRTYVTRSLERYGYKVTCVGSAKDALDAAQHNGPPTDLLLTDVVMPHMGGPELAQRLRETRPTLRVLFMSGYPGEELEQQGSVISPEHILFKPFTHEELARRVRQVLTPLDHALQE